MKRRGFTLIELMVVIGIILVLVAIVVLGLRHVNSQAASRETQSEILILSDLLTEYKNAHGSLSEFTPDPSQLRIPFTTGIEMPPTPATQGKPFPVPPGTISPMQTMAMTFPVYLDNPAAELVGAQPQSALTNDDFSGGMSGGPTGTRDMGDKIGATSARYTSHAVIWTQAVDYLLLREPKNRSQIANNVPVKRILELPQGDTLPAGMDPLQSAVVLDGWGNPIVFVPRGGMHVTLDNSGVFSDWIVRSSGTLPILGGKVPPLGATDQPFFASAGQDGVFTDAAAANGATADYASDNIYSFQR